ncbi:MAG: hypothetical protein ABW157_14575 [Candidatus Thiodiazotropha sp. LLP2]
MYVSKLLTAAALATGLTMAGSSASAVDFKASHQWPGGKGDIRDEMVQIIARHMNDNDTGVKIKVYPGKSLCTPSTRWEGFRATGFN